MERILDQEKGIGVIRTKEDVKRKIKMLSSFYGSYACSEGIWRILLDVYDEEVARDYLKIGSIHRGGAAVDGRCGVVASAVAFLSYVAGRSSADEDNTRLEYWAKKIQDTFQQKFGTCDCGELWPKVEKQIENKELVPWTSCVIYEGLLTISDVVYDAYFDLKRRKIEEPALKEVVKNDWTEEIDRTKPEEVVNYVLNQNRKYQKVGYVCSESALRALLDGFGISWTEKEKQIASIYSKGCFTGGRCGIVEVGLIILSYKYGREDCREKYMADRMLSRKLHAAVEEKVGSTGCKELTKIQKDVEKSCPYMDKILEVVTLFIYQSEQMIKSELEDFCKKVEGELY